MEPAANIKAEQVAIIHLFYEPLSEIYVFLLNNIGMQYEYNVNSLMKILSKHFNYDLVLWTDSSRYILQIKMYWKLRKELEVEQT